MAEGACDDVWRCVLLRLPQAEPGMLFRWSWRCHGMRASLVCRRFRRLALDVPGWKEQRRMQWPPLTRHALPDGPTGMDSSCCVSFGGGDRFFVWTYLCAEGASPTLLRLLAADRLLRPYPGFATAERVFLTARGSSPRLHVC